MSKINHRTYQEHRASYDKIRDVIAGEDRLKNAGAQYLPEPEGMTPKQYNRLCSGIILLRRCRTHIAGHGRFCNAQ